MAQITQSEKNLMIGFGALLFIFANFYGIRIGLDKKAIAMSQGKNAKSELTRLRGYAEEVGRAGATREWTDKTMPGYKDDLEFQTTLIGIVKARADAAHLDEYAPIPKPEHRDPDKDRLYHRSGLDAKCSGDIEKILRFLHSVQGKENFIAVTQLEIAASPKEPEKITCNATFEQWWRPDSLEAIAATEASASATPEVPGAPSPEPGAPAPAEVAAPTPGLTPAPSVPVIEQPGADIVKMGAPPAAEPVPQPPVTQ
jgi:hypothetical protein